MSEYVKIKINKRFTDAGNQLWSPGVHEVDRRAAQSLIQSGDGEVVEVVEEPVEEPASEQELLDGNPERITAAKKGYVKRADRTEVFDNEDSTQPHEEN